MDFGGDGEKRSQRNKPTLSGWLLFDEALVRANLPEQRQSKQIAA
ncbi:hypothetical protein WP3W18E02_19540 [Klebsiella sp. WP3-W18-ESBL-02]|nr:hypothetical protein [Klebsiella sp. WP3-W18-ESBL-02]BBQ83425.1 hypothetical protein WP3W18E02_19540 [Klebsiella sp. WP3-W18-ESBL-02]